MPVYCYKCPVCGKTAEVNKPMSECGSPELCPQDSFVMNRDLQAEHGGRRHCAGTWPMASYAAGISPDEIAEFRKLDRANGVPTEYTPDGDPVFTSARHRREYCQAHGLYDRNAGFSDPVPANR